MADAPTPVPQTAHKMDDTRVPVIEGEYKGHLFFADHFGYRITYKGHRVITMQEGCRTATSTSVQRAKLAIDTLCDAYSVSG